LQGFWKMDFFLWKESIFVHKKFKGKPYHFLKHLFSKHLPFSLFCPFCQTSISFYVESLKHGSQPNFKHLIKINLLYSYKIISS
jgi:hypothetical protein